MTDLRATILRRTLTDFVARWGHRVEQDPHVDEAQRWLTELDPRITRNIAPRKAVRVKLERVA